VERLNGYLKVSFVVPLAATLRNGGLVLDAHTANRPAEAAHAASVKTLEAFDFDFAAGVSRPR